MIYIGGPFKFSLPAIGHSSRDEYTVFAEGLPNAFYLGYARWAWFMLLKFFDCRGGRLVLSDYLCFTDRGLYIPALTNNLISRMPIIPQVSLACVRRRSTKWARFAVPQWTRMGRVTLSIHQTKPWQLTGVDRLLSLYDTMFRMAMC